MIKITQIQVAHGQTLITFSYDQDDLQKTLVVDAANLVSRANQVSALLGRPCSNNEMKAIIRQIFREVRQSQTALSDFDFSALQGDLES